MANQNKIDEIVSMLDNFVLNGGGHMNIQVNDAESLDEVTIKTYNSSDCCNGACKIPTPQEDIDKE